ncbi:hypothetical protein EGO51_10715 [Haloarcula hispanica]|uniref:Uncharacterized protein n=1 Tax=Haloarcula hispanica TaxID=51589 RepID=A0A5J5LLE3_HALHI|nr:hypothetical protein [Haloarcula hispanica]KAA9410254.1 hypothetical protein EGO51_10715 [Haloarcula hispanica]
MDQSDDLGGSLNVEVGEDVPIHNTKDPDEVFLTSKSKLKLALLEYKEGVKSLRAWVNPLVLLMTVGSILLVGNFQKTYGVPAEFWRAIYFITAIISIFWLVYSLYSFYENRQNAKVDSIIKQLKKEEN